MFTELPAKPMPLSVIAPEGGPDVGETLKVGGAKEVVNVKFTYWSLTV